MTCQRMPKCNGESNRNVLNGMVTTTMPEAEFTTTSNSLGKVSEESLKFTYIIFGGFRKLTMGSLSRGEQHKDHRILFLLDNH